MGKLTRQERQKIVSMGLEGKSIKEIKDATGRSREAIVPELGRAGIDFDSILRKARDRAARDFYNKLRKSTDKYVSYYAFDELDPDTKTKLTLAKKEEVVAECKSYRELLMSDYGLNIEAESNIVNGDSLKNLEERVSKLEKENSELKTLIRGFCNKLDQWV